MHYNYDFSEVEIQTLKIMLKWCSCKIDGDIILDQGQSTFVKTLISYTMTIEVPIRTCIAIQRSLILAAFVEGPEWLSA